MTGRSSLAEDVHSIKEQTSLTPPRNHGTRNVQPRYRSHRKLSSDSNMAPVPDLNESPTTSVAREKLFAEFEPLVRRLVRRYGTTEESRQEMVGEIYYRFCRLVEAYDPKRGVPLHPYMVHTLSASVHTYARQCWTHSTRVAPLEDAESGGAKLLSTDPTSDWDRQLLFQQLRAALPGAFGQISPRQRQIVVWRYYEGLTYEEIADKLQIRPASVRSLLSHGLKNLRGWMIQNQLRWDQDDLSE